MKEIVQIPYTKDQNIANYLYTHVFLAANHLYNYFMFCINEVKIKIK